MPWRIAAPFSPRTKVRRRQWMKTEHGDFATMEELAWTLNINTALPVA